MRFENRIVVITGAAQGIGASIANRFSREGAKSIFLLDWNNEKLTDTVNLINSQRPCCKGIQVDVSDEKSVKKAFQQIYQEYDDIDILVNNAGITRDAMFHKMSTDQWMDVINVNLTGIYHCCKAVVANMRNRKYGRIVNISSVSAFGNIGQTNYGASKAAVIGFTKCLAKEMARNNCTVNCVAPSYIDTEMLRSVPENVMQRFIDSIPMGRLGSPEELASVVTFLSSDDASFVTGECIVVSGGSYM